MKRVLSLILVAILLSITITTTSANSSSDEIPIINATVGQRITQKYNVNNTGNIILYTGKTYFAVEVPEAGILNIEFAIPTGGSMNSSNLYMYRFNENTSVGTGLIYSTSSGGDKFLEYECEEAGTYYFRLETLYQPSILIFQEVDISVELLSSSSQKPSEINTTLNFDLNKDIAGANKVADVPIKWHDNIFWWNSTGFYNHSISKIAMALSASAYNENHIKNALNKLYFEDVKLFNYSQMNDSGAPDTVAYSFSHTTLNIEGGLKYNLIAVVVRGTPGDKEWYSNFNISSSNGGKYNDVDHVGFKLAADKLYDNLEEYIYNHDELSSIEENKILITGHSRGAAVANLVSAELTKTQKYAIQNNIYGYTFATPNVTTRKEAKTKTSFENIFNLVNAEDFVPYIPLAHVDWGYWKYGQTLTFPSKGVNEEYETTYKRQMDNSFLKLTGANFKSYGKGYSDVQKFSNEMNKLAPTVKDYYTKEKGWTETTPEEYFNKLAEFLAGDANNATFYTYMLSRIGNAYYGPVTRFFVGNAVDLSVLENRMFYSHAPETYISWLDSCDKAVLKEDYKIKKVTIKCPVDIEVYNSDGLLVDNIVNNVVSDITDVNTASYVEGDEKTIYLPIYDTYTLNLLGTDIGTMNYTVETIDVASGDTTEQKEFINVVLYDGKEMISKITDTPDIELLISDKENIIGEILEDGQEIIYSYGLKGDVNQDKTIDISDALLLQKHIAKLITFTEEIYTLADVNSDTQVDISDALLVQKHIAKLINLEDLKQTA